jgi:hypothetical protein
VIEAVLLHGQLAFDFADHAGLAVQTSKFELESYWVVVSFVLHLKNSMRTVKTDPGGPSFVCPSKVGTFFSQFAASFPILHHGSKPC